MMPILKAVKRPSEHVMERPAQIITCDDPYADHMATIHNKAKQRFITKQKRGVTSHDVIKMHG
jgi:hypothetical protein